METEDIINISIPVYLNSLYVSSRHVERVELLLEIYTTLSSFFNAVVADTIRRLVEDGRLRDYVVEANSEDDAIVTNYLDRSFRSQIDNRRFGSRLLDDTGYSASELKSQLKLTAYYLVEATLATVCDYACDEAKDRGKRLSHIVELVADREVGDKYGVPTQLVIEAQVALDSFRRLH